MLYKVQKLCIKSHIYVCGIICQSPNSKPILQGTNLWCQLSTRAYSFALPDGSNFHHECLLFGGSSPTPAALRSPRRTTVDNPELMPFLPPPGKEEVGLLFVFALFFLCTFEVGGASSSSSFSIFDSNVGDSPSGSDKPFVSATCVDHLRLAVSGPLALSQSFLYKRYIAIVTLASTTYFDL